MTADSKHRAADRALLPEPWINVHCILIVRHGGGVAGAICINIDIRYTEYCRTDRCAFARSNMT